MSMKIRPKASLEAFGRRHFFLSQKREALLDFSRTIVGRMAACSGPGHPFLLMDLLNGLDTF